VEGEKGKRKGEWKKKRGGTWAGRKEKGREVWAKRRKRGSKKEKGILK
jgi:hypothetical protein